MRPTQSLLLLAGTAFVASVVLAQQLERKPIQPTAVNDGAEMYNAYCSACHGPGGKGDGPAAKALKTPASDLTLLTRDNDGVFPSNAILNTLRPGGGGAHGSTEMPVWGDVFRLSGNSESEVMLRNYNLLRFLESIQAPAPPPVKKVKEPAAREMRISDVRPHLGGGMYRAYCASCHGVDGRGEGPAAFTLLSKPADLTKLRGSDGKFPANKVYTLLNKPQAAAHGSSEMPVWGNLFRTAHEDDAIISMRVNNIIRYLESIQR